MSHQHYGTIPIWFTTNRSCGSFAVRFYITIYVALQRMSNGKVITDLNQCDDIIGSKEAYQIFSVGDKRSFLFVLVHSVLSETRKTAMTLAKLKWTEALHRFGRRLFGGAIKNPFRFRRRLVKVLTLIRYVKYGFPLVSSIESRALWHWRGKDNDNAWKRLQPKEPGKCCGRRNRGQLKNKMQSS